VSDAAIAAAMRLLWEVLKIAVEPSGAVAFAAVAERRVPVAGLRVGIVLSGGNVEYPAAPAP
jgi:threonine dehydratase